VTVHNHQFRGEEGREKVLLNNTAVAKIIYYWWQMNEMFEALVE
jgi:hypothetical protein